jgi:hypothetical protein
MKTATPSASGSILAIDLGKYKSVACVYDPATDQAHFHTLPTSGPNSSTSFPRSQAEPGNERESALDSPHPAFAQLNHVMASPASLGRSRRSIVRPRNMGRPYILKRHGNVPVPGLLFWRLCPNPLATSANAVTTYP